ncbi:MAG: hypothetical protein M8352_02535 [ANME-2 cluster archaeon]|nr:hypothetical protein [ANME-2 cluster archaeon]
MLIVTGTYPDIDGEIIRGNGEIIDGTLVIRGKHIEVCAGTPAMVAAAISACSGLGIDPPYCILAGDTGREDGSINLYTYLRDELLSLKPEVITMHYMAPRIEGMVDFGFALEDSAQKPILIADAGAMYGAKISGLGHIFDLFTPDRGELAFLADEHAAHPMFVNENLYDYGDDRLPELIKKTFDNGLSPGTMLVKGSTDYIVRNGTIIRTVDSPDIPAMEAVGGTGDTLTGIVSALVYQGEPLENACYLAARTNRLAGQYADVRPDSSIVSLIEKIPQAMKAVMEGIDIE